MEKHFPKYTQSDGLILKDGHTMPNFDIVQALANGVESAKDNARVAKVKDELLKEITAERNSFYHKYYELEEFFYSIGKNIIDKYEDFNKKRDLIAGQPTSNFKNLKVVEAPRVYISNILSVCAFNKLKSNGYNVSQVNAEWIICINLDDGQELVAYETSKIFQGAAPTLHIKNGSHVSKGVCNRNKASCIVADLSNESKALNLLEAVEYMKTILSEFES